MQDQGQFSCLMTIFLDPLSKQMLRCIKPSILYMRLLQSDPNKQVGF